MHRYRSHTCAALRAKDAGDTARLSGWVHRVRDHGGVLFIDLRDHYGITQVVADPDSPAFKTAERVRSEWVIRVDGDVRRRDEGTVNADLPTGKIELFAREIEALGEARELPLPVFGEPDYPEDIRLAYRFLDLRRETLHANIVTRTRVVRDIRNRMEAAGFTEFATPVLSASSPEGARDFLVPSRIHPGEFYALPQAPQIYKQLLMVAGFDRYFQIAPCFRDEDPRADRLPGEFHQLDLEMSFVTQDDVLGTMEPILRDVFAAFADGKPVTQSFRRIPYDEAIRLYGSDKPDLRIPIEMQDVSEHFRGSGFKVFAGMLEKGEANRVWAIPGKTGGSRAFCDRMNSWAQQQGQPGLGYIFWRSSTNQSELSQYLNRFDDIRTGLAQLFADREGRAAARVAAKDHRYEHEHDVPPPTDEDEEDAVRRMKAAEDAGQIEEAEIIREAYFGELEPAGPIAKNIGRERTEALRRQLGLGSGDAVFFAAGDPKQFASFAGDARIRIGEELDLIDRDRFELCWITDFPFYERNGDTGEIEFGHNPFTMPQGGMEALAGDPLAIKAYQYDLVCNGFEIGSGGIRNNDPKLMVEAFRIAGLGADVVEERFGALYRAFQYGAPPHGGMATGIDRMVMLICGTPNVREVVPFPMNQQARDLLMGAPAEPMDGQLKELGLRVAPKPKG